MARLFLLFVVFLDLLVTLAAARPTPVGFDIAGSLGEADSPSSSAVGADRGEPGLAGPPEALQHEKHHRASDKSIAGAEVILGGLATAILGAIFAYIRVTRRESSENKA